VSHVYTYGDIWERQRLIVAALNALQRKKQLEKELDKWTNTKNTIEAQVFTLENANINLETMKAMQSGATAMKGIHGSLYVQLLSPELTFIQITRESGYDYG